MKRPLGLLLVLMIGCATGAAVRDLVVPARAQNATGPTYEYKIVKSPFGGGSVDWYQETVDRFAHEGWRFTNTIQRADYVFLSFERSR